MMVEVEVERQSEVCMYIRQRQPMWRSERKKKRRQEKIRVYIFNNTAT